MKSLLILLLCALYADAAFLDIFPRCKSTDEECIKKAIESSLKLIKNGLPALNIPVIDPLSMNELTLPYNSSFGWMSMKLKDATLHGLRNIKVLSTQNNFTEGGLNMNAIITAENIQLKSSEYNVTGFVIDLPLSGSGKCNIDFNNVTVEAKLENVEEIKDGEKYIKVKEFIVNINPSQITFDLPNLKAGDKYAGDALGLLINNLHQQIYKEIQATIQNQLGEILKNITNNFFSMIPYETLFVK